VRAGNSGGLSDWCNSMIFTVTSSPTNTTGVYLFIHITLHHCIIPLYIAANSSSSSDDTATTVASTSDSTAATVASPSDSTAAVLLIVFYISSTIIIFLITVMMIELIYVRYRKFIIRNMCCSSMHT